MENASKALIIAGAILISILIIGLGVLVFNMASSTTQRVNLNSQEAEAHNQQFSAYFGNRRSSTEVKNLMSAIRSNNITGTTNGDTSNITVVFAEKGETLTVAKPAKVSASVKSGNTYWIGVLNDKAAKDDDAASATASGDGSEAYYSTGYLRIICVYGGGEAPTNVE